MHRPKCNKMYCDKVSDARMQLGSWGWLYFCASCALANLWHQESEAV